MTDIWSLGLVGVGGAVGAMARFGLDHLGAKWGEVRRYGVGLPIGIGTANVLACFILGFLVSLASGPWALLLAVGLTGSLSTYSTFALDTVELFRGKHEALAVINVVLSVSLGVGALMLGIILGEALAA